MGLQALGHLCWGVRRLCNDMAGVETKRGCPWGHHPIQDFGKGHWGRQSG